MKYLVDSNGIKTKRALPLCIASIDSTLQRKQAEDVSTYLGISEEAFCAIINNDFNSEILRGHVLTVEPNLTPKLGDIVFYLTGSKKTVEFYQPPRSHLYLVGRENKRQAPDTERQIVGVVTAHTRSLRK